jgi:hypothetical protein
LWRRFGILAFSNEKIVGAHRGKRTVANRRRDLAQRCVAYVARGEYARDVRTEPVIGLDVAGAVQFQQVRAPTGIGEPPDVDECAGDRQCVG